MPGMVTPNTPTTSASIDSMVLSLARMARRADVSPRWLRAEAEAGRVPCLRADAKLLFNPDAVLRILADRAATECVAQEVARG